ncbi:DoxX family protein [Nocardia sp. NPDC059177]|uniref:DoxX family protein n=1 Tax=Nocardia sp. NPDC059177 TaxID=3346759 RepID=UPI003683865B
MTAFDTGVLILRVCLGLTMAAHGYSKFFAGGRIPGTARWFDSIGMSPGRVHARLAAGSEVGAGLALALGLCTPVAAAGFVALMLVAAWTVHRRKGFFIVGDGWEYNLVLAVGAVGVAVTGPGRASLDEVILGADRVDGWWGFGIAAGVGLAAGLGQLALFYRPPAPSSG